MKKIVFFDVDGTLVDDATRIFPQSAIDAISALRQHGHLAIINTGRPYAHIEPRVLEQDWDGCVSACGQEVRAEGRVIYSVAPTKELCAKIRDIIRTCAMGVFYETERGYVLDGQRYLPSEGLSEVKRMEKKGLPVEYDPDREDFAFEKFVTYEIPGCDRERFWREASEDFNLIDRGNGMIEAVLAGNSKATGIARILEHFSMSRQDAAAFGDSPNDLAMFACVNNPIAMGGSAPVLAQEAVYVTAPVLEDGIAKGLRWLCAVE